MIPLYKPIYLPQNSEAQALIDELANELCLTLNGKTGLKHRAVRRQSFWNQRRLKLRESLAHLVGIIMRRAGGDASVAFRVSFV